MVDVQAKTAGDKSNAVAGYWISSTGANAPGSVASPSEGAGGGPGSIMNSTLPTPAHHAAADADFAHAGQRRAAARLPLRKRGYSIFTPAARITGAHLAISSLDELRRALGRGVGRRHRGDVLQELDHVGIGHQLARRLVDRVDDVLAACRPVRGSG